MAATFEVLRLEPGEKIMERFRAWVATRGSNFRGAYVATTVGSASAATVRLAHATAENKNEIVTVREPHEITSLVGTLTRDGLHIHATFADLTGRCLGGHLIEATVFTTAEIVLGCVGAGTLRRKPDARTGFDELVVESDSVSRKARRWLLDVGVPAAMYVALGAVLVVALKRTLR